MLPRLPPARVLWSALIAGLLTASFAPAQTVLYRVNAGGPQLAAADGSIPPWSGDPQGAPSPYVNLTGSDDLTFSTASSVTLGPEVPGSVPMALFQTERWDAPAAPEMRWSFPVGTGVYEVRLLFAEIYPGAQGAGLRVFDVAIEGATVLYHYDQYADVGGDTGTMKSFNVHTSDGNLNIEFLHVTENPGIKGIEILAFDHVIQPRPPGTLTVVNAGAGGQTDPHISGVYVSYTDQPNGLNPPFMSFVRYYNLATNSDAGIPNSGEFDQLSDVNGSMIVFSRVTQTASAIFRYDISTLGPTLEVDPVAGSSRREAAIGSSTVAWQDNGSASNPSIPELVSYDINAGIHTQLTNDSAYDQNPATAPDGRLIVWVKCQGIGSNCDIWQATLQGGAWSSQPLAVTSSDEFHPDTDGQIIVYFGGQDTFLQSVGGGVERQLALPGQQSNPSISGGLVTMDYRDVSDPINPSSDILLFDPSTDIVYRITDTPQINETLNDISVGQDGLVRVVWSVSEGATGRNVYAYTFERPGMSWPVCGVAVSAASDIQFAPASVADGYGGAIVAWMNSKPPGPAFVPPSLSIGRVNGAGALLWGAGGVPLANSVGDPPRITTDGAGGAIVAWVNYYHERVYAQRVNAAGVPQWGAGGLVLCTEPGASSPVPVADGAGGAIIAWHDSRGGTADVYAQRVSASGAIAWTADGVALSLATGNQSYVDLVSDGNNGAIVTWFDTRNGNNDVYAQRIGASGAIAWTTADGVAICTAPGDQDYTPIISDGAGGAIIAWHDGRATDRRIYAQRVSGGGATQWGSDGVHLTPLVVGQQGFPALVADGAGGAIVAWQDDVDAGEANIYARRVSAMGVPQGPNAGVPLCTANDQQTAPKLVADGEDGALATWQDEREGTHTEIYAQHVTFAGALADGWPADGLVLCPDHYHQQAPVIVSDAADGAIVAWEDWRSGLGDIYAARVRGTGSVVTAVPPTLASASRGLSAWPNPFRGELRLGFELPAAMEVRLEVFDVHGRRVHRSAPLAYAPGRQALTWDGRGDNGARQAAGIYFVRLRGPGFSVTRRVVRLK